MTCDSDELWRPVVGLEGRYEVSSRGQVRSATTRRIKVIGRNSKGYPNVDLYLDNGKAKVFAVHRLVARAFLGESPAGHQVNHKDGKKRNAAVCNLEYVTPSQNMRHACDTGLLKPHYGPRDRSNWKVEWVAHPRKLTAENVVAIRAMSKTMPTKAIAEKMKLHRGAVWAIVARKRWAHLP